MCGYSSDKNGTKAKFIEKLRKEYGFEYLRFDYSGHGDSSGDSNNLYISDWVYESKVLIESKLTTLIIVDRQWGVDSLYLSLV